MVIATSDSCNTLVTLENGIKQINNKDVAKNVSHHGEQYRQTKINCPIDEMCDDDSDYWKWQEQSLYLPLSGPVDQYLKNVPEIMESCDQLLANPPRRFDKSSTERILYVAQGEVGHAISKQCDVIVSDKATTCHILALRSEFKRNSPLSTITHIDDANYESSVRLMIQEHISHHRMSDSTGDKVEMKIHVVGGFEDEKESSRKISNWLINLLAQIADEEKKQIKMTLQTCAISSMNDSGYSCPIGRGLGLDTRTGEVFLASVASEVAGPGVVLRSVRLWSQGERTELSVIHTAKSDEFQIDAFSFEGCRDLQQLLQLPDKWLLQYTSTSPNVEESDFCKCARATLQFMLEVKCTQVFGSTVDRPLVFRRTASANSWRRCH